MKNKMSYTITPLLLIFFSTIYSYHLTNPTKSPFIQIQGIEIQDYVNDNGFFSESSLAEFLVQAYNQKLLINADFAKVESLYLENIMGKAIATGSNQLFRVTSLHKPFNKYIIKELKYKNEAIEQINSFHINALKPFIERVHQVKNDYPILIFPTVFIIYHYKGKEHILSIMPQAPGALLQHLLENFCKKANDKNEDLVKIAFRRTGIVLGNFHMRFMLKNSLNTLIHGDFHPANILFDKQTGSTYFIDNQHIAKYYHNRANCINDFKKLTRWCVFIVERMNSSDSLKSNLEYSALKEFFTGYFGICNSEMQNLILKRLRTSLNDYDWYHASLSSATKSKCKKLLQKILKYN